MNLAMGRISDSLTVLYFALAAGIYLKPELYAGGEGKIENGEAVADASHC
jgi:hypothetical protein